MQTLTCCATFARTAGAAAGPVLIPHGGFESGDLRAWTVASQAESDDRWELVMELLMACGSFSALEPPLPPGLQAALQAELRTFR